ncbi:MAG: hypothetical protein JWO50_723 [Candidatus Kaiserbacteria bacterium]|nr:hypothetical protein [Candidatus Kaiserbacteria bacterium]
MVILTEPGQYDMLRDIDRLTKENNQLLHSMRRASFIGGVLKVIMYIIFLGAPIWIYLTYFSGTVDGMITMYQQAKTLNTQTQSKFTGFEDMVKQMQSVLHTAAQKLATSSENGTSSVR